MSIVPVHIRPHLVAYFFKEMEGDTVVYLGKKVKAAKISINSSLGRTMRMCMVSVGHPVKPDDTYQLYLSVEDDPVAGKNYVGNYYKFESGSKKWLMLPPEVSHDFNLLLEDIFRANFLAFMDGYLQGKKIDPGNNSHVAKGIDIFIDKYDLLEAGFSRESFRQIYYREKKKVV